MSEKVITKADALTTKRLFGYPEHSIAYEMICRYDHPWNAIPHISEFIAEIASTLSPDEYRLVGNNVWISKDATISPTAYINGPCIICAGAEIRHCAFIRGSAIVGAGAVVGNSVELKNCILFDNVQVPHFNYVGDSILGYKAHMGAGAITSNVKSDKSLVTVNFKNEKIESGLKKFGAILGDHVEVGCNSVLNPGTVIGRYSNVYPLSSVRGYVPENSIFKSRGDVIKKS